jgi:hypothetical protein
MADAGMRRRLLNLLTVLSLLLFAGVCAAWRDSYHAENVVSYHWYHDRDGDPHTERRVMAGWCRGILQAEWSGSGREVGSPAPSKSRGIPRAVSFIPA